MAPSNPARRIARSFQVLTSTPKRNITFETRRDRYYKLVWLDRQIWEAIDFLSKVNRVSKMQVANDMMRLGIGHYFGARIAEQNRLTATQRERGKPERPTYFTVMLRHWARMKGFDIGKFI